MTDFQKDFIGLINSAFNGIVAEVSDDFDWNHAYNCAKSHQITPLLYYGITNSKLTIPAEIKSKFENATMQNIVLNQNQMYFLKVLFATFEKDSRKKFCAPLQSFPNGAIIAFPKNMISGMHL